MFRSICGSDVHYLCHGRIGVSHNLQILRYQAHFGFQDFVVNEPMVLGHESAGVVVQGEFCLLAVLSGC